MNSEQDFTIVSKEEVDELKPILARRAYSAFNSKVRQLKVGEALKINKHSWMQEYKVAPAPYGVTFAPAKFAKYSTPDGLYWLIVREK